MNFLEALEKLKNGECEGIQFQNSIMFILRSDGRLINECNKPLLLLASSYLSDDWTLVNPKPVYQEQEIKIYYNTKTGETKKIYPDASMPKLSSDWIFMTGIQKVEVKKPVKQSKVLFKSDPNKIIGMGVLRVNVDDSISMPYDKHAKNAVITLTWEEHENNPTEDSDEITSSDLPVDKFIVQTIIDDLIKKGPVFTAMKRNL